MGLGENQVMSARTRQRRLPRNKLSRNGVGNETSPNYELLGIVHHSASSRAKVLRRDTADAGIVIAGGSVGGRTVDSLFERRGARHIGRRYVGEAVGCRYWRSVENPER